MTKTEFKAESRRLLDIMIHSIYTHREIFLRELISNASDALDKRYYQTLTERGGQFDRDDFFIRIEADKTERTLTIRDTGIGMTKEEIEDNLGTIARSGSLDFKTNNTPKDGVEIIGQFGVGFYSAFMVAKDVTVVSRAAGSDEAWEWRSEGADGYTVQRTSVSEVGTTVRLVLKDDTEEDRYDEFLEEYRLKNLVRQYSDFIKYPIKMRCSRRIPKEGKTDEFEERMEDETLNSMVPLWRKNKSELTGADYDSFYTDKHFGFEKPLRHIHVSADGAVSFSAILYIPAKAPYNFYTREYEKGLELYSNGVMIMRKCGDLLPDHFSFVQGLVDSADLSLNISREMLQHDRQLKRIAKRLSEKIRAELLAIMDTERPTYEAFFEGFGRQLKYGVYAEWGAHKDILQDLLLFYSSTEKKPTSLKEYTARMKEGQKSIYYAAGESIGKLSRLPQSERLSDEGYEILFFTDDIDEFAIRVLSEYDGKPFKNVSDGTFDSGENATVEETDEEKNVFAAVKDVLGDAVKGVRASVRLKKHPACFATEGEVSIEMEKVLSRIPDSTSVKAEKYLEINTQHPAYTSLVETQKSEPDKFSALARVLYNQALLAEGLSIEDPVAFSDDIWAVALG